MGSDDKGKSMKETIADEAKGLAVEVYRDGAKPVVGAVGDTLGAIAKLVLWPVRKIAEGANAALERLSARVEKKLEGIPEDRLLPPPSTIAAPAALQYALLGEGDEVSDLREMFENLLVTSMDRDTASSAHPAFVSILAQLTSDEAWILKSITDTEQSFAIVRARQINPDGNSFQQRGGLCTLGLGIGIDESRQAQYLTNLSRLGLLDIEWDKVIVDIDAGYDELERRIRARPDLRDVKLKTDQGAVAVTPLGVQFWHTCIRSRAN